MERKHTYGPVASRRLGRSLGVDLVPSKTCNLNCVYCQLGRTDRLTLEREDYAPADEIVEEVRASLAKGPRPDYITLGGSGEPTLHLRFGDVAARIRQFTDVPIALLTNGTLFHLPEVRCACAAIDLILPTLDAGDEETFRRIHRPHPTLTLGKVVEGLAALRDEFAGQVWLEVFMVEGANDSDEQVRALKACVERIRPHRVQINTAVRPPAEKHVGAPSEERLEAIRRLLAPDAEIIASVRRLSPAPASERQKEEVLAMLRRRPCTVHDVADGLGIPIEEADRHVRALLDGKAIQRRQRRYETYYEVARNAPGG